MKKWLGISLIILGLILILNSSLISITGNVIGGEIKAGGSILGFVILAGGLALLLARKEGGLENRASQILKSGKIVTKARELRKIVLEMGYTLGKEKTEGTQVLTSDGRYLTIIPKGPEVSKPTYYSIIKALATGEPSLRSSRLGFQTY